MLLARNIHKVQIKAQHCIRFVPALWFILRIQSETINDIQANHDKRMSTVILKYPAGNVFSVRSALHHLGEECEITDSEESLRKADHVIIPGQGEAAVTMDYLRKSGLDRIIADLRQPVLGICIGLQLMCEESEEGNAQCLEIFPGVKVRRFRPEHGEKIPQMGWNNINSLHSALFTNIDEGSYVYFVHSYYADMSEYTIAVADYCGRYSAALQRDNYYAVQFHPEKSGSTGLQILNNFLKL